MSALFEGFGFGISGGAPIGPRQFDFNPNADIFRSLEGIQVGPVVPGNIRVDPFTAADLDAIFASAVSFASQTGAFGVPITTPTSGGNVMPSIFDALGDLAGDIIDIGIDVLPDILVGAFGGDTSATSPTPIVTDPAADAARVAAILAASGIGPAAGPGALGTPASAGALVPAVASGLASILPTLGPSARTLLLSLLGGGAGSLGADALLGLGEGAALATALCPGTLAPNAGVAPSLLRRDACGRPTGLITRFNATKPNGNIEWYEKVGVPDHFTGYSRIAKLDAKCKPGKRRSKR